MIEPAVINGRGHSVDLHTHSTFSDGLLSPTKLVSEAASHGINVLALTDHDTLEGLPEAIEASRVARIELIPGVELSAESGAHEVHILGYFVDSKDPILDESLAENAGERIVRTRRIIEILESLGLPVSFERVEALAGEGTIGRPHVARAMIENGYVRSVSQAFELYLGIGRPAFVPRARSKPDDAVRLIRRAGAVPVLAHPLSAGNVEATLQLLVPAGLLGIEVYYGEYPARTHAQLKEIAGSWGLVATGGSDYHGPGYKEGRDIGTAPVPVCSVDELKRVWRSSLDHSSFSN